MSSPTRHTTAPEPKARVVTTGLRFPEGPIAMPDGSVILVEIERGTLSRVQPDGRVEVIADCGGGPNGAAFGPDGRIWLCNNGGRDERGCIQAVDIQTGNVETIYTEVEGQRLSAPNDLVFDRDGGFWFTDHGSSWPRHRDHGGLYYARSDGSSIRELVYPLDAPNGVGLSPDERTVYVAETHTGRLRGFDVTAPGELALRFGKETRGRLHGEVDDDQLLDSLAVDGEGRVCVATVRSGGITVFATDGSKQFVPTGDRITTNICFGGADMRTAWITGSRDGVLLRTTWDAPGHRLNFNPY
ncbi:MAG: SMP-30/gluconolactonase/LRE family protein [Gammaproteobacteria bacterium]|nr:SMP-30/gluconolactonase/LRE family protein [Gammaproteobacteria bacterium]